jgi:hypothetical protein
VAWIDCDWEVAVPISIWMAFFQFQTGIYGFCHVGQVEILAKEYHDTVTAPHVLARSKSFRSLTNAESS